MHMKTRLKRIPLSLVTKSLALAMGLLDSQPTLADGCGAYCKARTVRDICHEAVVAKRLTSHQRDVEFEKCKTDPVAYQQIEELTDDNVDFLD